MSVAARLDLGADRQVLDKALKSIPAKGFDYKISTVVKNAISVCDFDVILDEEHENHDHDMEYLFGHEEHEHSHEHDHQHEHEHDESEHEHEHEHHHDESEHEEAVHEHHHEHEHEHHEHTHDHHHEHRHLSDVYKIIDGTEMTENARALAKRIFKIVAQAEAMAHNRPIEEVHFHEVGAIDSIVDVIAIAVCFDNLGIDRVYVPKLAEGYGTIRCQHGILPVPVPAVSNIAAEYGLNFEFINQKGEFVTPTGAAFVAAVKTDDNLPSRFKIKKIGMGGGKRNYERPSILRAMIIEEKATQQNEDFDNPKDEDIIYKLESNIDDSSGEELGLVMELLLKAGAFDVHYTSCFMKKNRPGYMLSVICDKEMIPALEAIIFKNTTTIGIRRMKYERSILPRKIIEVQTKWGSAKAKQVILPDGEIRNYPEYESIVKLCRENNLSYKECYSQVFESIKGSV